MPNWVTNKVVIKGSDIGRIVRELGGKHTVFDFNAVIPMPPDSETFCANRGIGNAEREKFGENNWYDWSCKHWGTKWNACESLLQYAVDGEAVFWLDTAWSFPEPVMVELSRKYGVQVECSYYDEDIGTNCGKLVVESGRTVSHLHYDGDTNAALDFIAGEFGADVLDGYGLVRGEDGSWRNENE